MIQHENFLLSNTVIKMTFITDLSYLQGYHLYRKQKMLNSIYLYARVSSFMYVAHLYELFFHHLLYLQRVGDPLLQL